MHPLAETGVQTSVMSAKRARARPLSAEQRRPPVRFRWSEITISVPGRSRVDAPGAFVCTTSRAPSRRNSRTGCTTGPRRPLVDVEPALQHDHGTPRAGRAAGAPRVPGRCGRPAGTSPRTGSRPLFSSSSARLPSPDPARCRGLVTSAVRPADGLDQRLEPGWLLRRGNGRPRSGRRGGHLVHAPRIAVRPGPHHGPLKFDAGGSTDTGMPVTSFRAPTATTLAGCRRWATKRPSDRERRSFDVISDLAPHWP